MSKVFDVGQIYKRTEIHNEYGGQRQGGISTPAKLPYIFLFTGGSGTLYGYKDKWQGKVFQYTGEGQRGNMEFVAGNRAIKDSVKNGEELHLFVIKEKGYVEYAGQFTYKGYHIENGLDVEKKLRELIIFELEPN